MSRFILFGTLFILVGIGMTIAKYLLDMEFIKSWALVPLILGILLNMIGRRQGETQNG